MHMRSVLVGTATVFLLAACGSSSESSDAAAAPSSPAAEASSAPASPSAEATSVAPASSSAAPGGRAQCAAVKKVYTAWAKTNTSLTASSVDAAIGAGNAFADVVRAYDDRASKALKQQITGYNVQMLIARAQVARDIVDLSTQENLEKAHDDVVAKYDAFRAAACK